jgi:hypothetical protein
VVFVQAYCYYRLGKLEQALSVVQQVGACIGVAVPYAMTVMCATGQWAGGQMQALATSSDLLSLMNHVHAAGTRPAAAAAAAARGAVALPFGRQQASHQSVPRAVPKAQGRPPYQPATSSPPVCLLASRCHTDAALVVICQMIALVLHTPVIQLNTKAVLRLQVQSLELRTNVLAAYVCGGHADEVRWRFV